MDAPCFLESIRAVLDLDELSLDFKESCPHGGL
jgi:hypothetical protein